MTDYVKQEMSAGEQATTGQGLFFKLVDADDSVDIVIDGVDGYRHRASNVPAGYRFGPVPETRRFRKLTITSNTPQTIAWLVGDDVADVDDVNVALTAGVHRGANTMKWSDAIVGISNNNIPLTLGVTLTKAVYRGILVKAPSSNTGTVYISDLPMSAINEGLPVEPGESQWLPLGNTKTSIPELNAYASAANQRLHFLLFGDDVELKPDHG